MDTLHWLLQMPWVRGAISGAVSAAATDLHAFLTWKDWTDVGKYQWGTATFRWFVGAVTGGLTGAGLGAML